MALSALSLKVKAKQPGRYSDGQGLFLDVKPTGSASWIVRIQKDGRRRDHGLGGYPRVSLALARQLAAQKREQVAQGLDPVAERKRVKNVPTFEHAARLVHKQRRAAWSNGKHQDQWINTLEKYAFPALGPMKINVITGGDVFSVLNPIWLTKRETAKRLAQRIRAVLDWAHSAEYRDAEAPMRSILSGLPKQSSLVKHHAAMPYAEVPAFVSRLRERTTWGRLALETAILTAARSGEVRGATWAEVDLDARLWTVPGERMKVRTAKPHVVPLSDAAIDAFERARVVGVVGSDLVFPGAVTIRSMSDMTLTKVLRDMGLPYTAHGFRSSFRDWVAEETNFAGELAEAALAHAVPSKVEAAYRRGNLLTKRRELMNAWGAYCSSQSAPADEQASARCVSATVSGASKAILTCTPQCLQPQYSARW